MIASEMKKITPKVPMPFVKAAKLVHLDTANAGQPDYVAGKAQTSRR